MSTGLIVVFIVVLGLIYLLGRNFWQPFFLVFNFLLKGALGAFGIYLFNLLAVIWKVEIPLNPFNALWAGFLGLPGLLSLLVMRYWLRI